MTDTTEYKPRESHGLRRVDGITKTWNGVTVRALEFHLFPGRVWHDLSSDRDTLAIVLQEVGGRCESRIRLDARIEPERLSSRHMSLLPAGMPVWGYADEIRCVRAARLLFDAPALSAVLGEELDTKRAAAPRLMFSDERISIFGDILAAECRTPNDYSSLYAESIIAAVFVHLLRLGKHQGGHRQWALPKRQFRRVIDYIEENLAGPINLKDLAQMSGLSQAQFGRAFKAATGFSPHRWLLEARVRRAQRLLLDADTSLSEIALSVGFSEQSHFTRVFQRVVGATPGSWRRDRSE